MENPTNNKKLISDAAETLGLDVTTAIEILKKEGITINEENPEIGEYEFQILQKEKMKLDLKRLRDKDLIPPPLPPNVAMCYCPSPNHSRDDDGGGGNNKWFSKIAKIVLALIIIGIIAYFIVR